MLLSTFTDAIQPISECTFRMELTSSKLRFPAKDEEKKVEEKLVQIFKCG